MHSMHSMHLLVALLSLFFATDARFTSLDGLLWHPLPEVEVTGSSSSVCDHDEDRHTRPTAVLQWSTFFQEVKQRMSQPDIVVSFRKVVFLNTN